MSIGGSAGRNEATARGCLFEVKEAVKKQGGSIKDAEVVIQGFGNVGGNAAKLFYKEKAKIIAVSDVYGGIYNKQGLDPYKVDEHVKKTGSVVKYPGALRKKSMSGCNA